MEFLIICLIALAVSGFGGSILDVFVKHDHRTLMEQYEDKLRKEGKIK